MARFPIRDVSAGFYSESIALTPRLADVRGSAGSPGRRYGDPVTLACQVDPISAEVAMMAGVEDIRAMYEVHLSADPGPDFDEGTTAASARTGPGVVVRKMVWAANHVV